MTDTSPTCSEKQGNNTIIQIKTKMVLIFGGTTEGRIAAEVCEEAGKPFYYSTKSANQKVDLHNGIRLTGGMNAFEISRFCKEHGIRCIVDAAHPFAENLHKEIDKAQKLFTDNTLIVARLQRNFSEKRQEAIYCDSFNDAIAKIKTANVKCLLSLCGANTISKLKPYLSQTKTVFRILDRKESIDIAQKNGLSKNEIIFYNDNNNLPSCSDEEVTMRKVGCDAILTKESGSTGGFDNKVDAAIKLGIQVFVVRHPKLPDHWLYATGKYGLRRIIERNVSGFFSLKTGLSTGACATAAAKAAAISRIYNEYPKKVNFVLPDGEILSTNVEYKDKGVATVVKDINDDPDITKGCKITARVELNSQAHTQKANDKETEHPQEIKFLKGDGVGTVTLPGLGIPVGEPAVNPTPREMINKELKQITSKSLNVTISVENGEELAKKTFNSRVGVIGGISILGTSGIVRPLSNEAFVKSIQRELNVAWAIGNREIGLVAGMKSEKALKAEDKNLRCVHYGNFIGEALKASYKIGFKKVTLAIMIGKAVKLAEGRLDTHSHKFLMNKAFLRDVAENLNIDSSPIADISMARELWELMPEKFFERIKELCMKHCRTVYPKGELIIRLICDKQ